MNMTWLSGDLLSFLWRGFQLTIVLTVITSMLSLVMGVAVGTMRIAGRKWLRTTAVIYIEIHRNIPALVLIIIWAFAIPNIFPQAQRKVLFFDNAIMAELGTLFGLPLVYYALAVIVALSLNTSAYVAELFRAGVGTIPSEYAQAARTLGATQSQVFRKILMRQGIRAAFPAISTRLIHNMKNTSLAAFVAVPELFHSTQTAISKSFRAVELLILATILYLLLSALMAALLRAVERNMQRPPALEAAKQPAMEAAHG